MARRFLTNINLEKNEIQNVVIHKLAVAPGTPVDGQIYFNTSDERYYIRRSSGWKDVSGRIDDITAASGATYILVTDNGDGTLSIDVAGATSVQKGLMSATDKVKLDASASAATASTLVQRDASGDFAAHDITSNAVIISETQNGVTPINHAASIGYVNSIVQSGMKIKGSIDSSTNPDYPVATTGDAYYIVNSGRIGGGSGPLVKSGDLIIAVANTTGGSEATVGDEWIIIERNIDYANETVAGYVRLATNAEVTAGTVTDAVVTPSGLASWWSDQDISNKFSANVGLGDTTKVFVITHGLGTTDVQVQIKDNTTNELVETGVEITSVNTVTVSFNAAPALNAFRVIIQG